MKKRIDILLVEQGYFDSRERAKKAIMAGLVFVDNQRCDKAGTEVKEDANILVKGNPIPYVSRGGLKLEKAMKNFGVTLKDKVCMDIGASTGGFTDCMLQNGAVKVFSIDVGYGQLAWKLRQDERVVCMERTNIRYVTIEDTKEFADFASIDVSFISLKLVLPKAKELLNIDGEIVALIKPQFEAGKGKVGKKGVVRDKNIHIEVIEMISEFAIKNGFAILNLDYSPIKGPEGNIEYLIHLRNNNDGFVFDKEAFDKKGLIYGMGHAVYSISDPRAEIFKGFVQKLAHEKGKDKDFALYSMVEQLAPKIIGEERHIYKGVSANVDFYSGFVYSMLDLPTELFTPMFAIARIVGWSAHRMEELINMDKIIRPAYKTVKEEEIYRPLEER